MAMFVKIDDRAAFVIVVIAAVAIFAVVYPDQFSSMIDTIMGVVTGAVDGARGAV